MASLRGIFEGCFKRFPGIGTKRKFISKITLKIIDLFTCHCYPGPYRWLLSFPFSFQGEGELSNDQPVVGETISFCRAPVAHLVVHRAVTREVVSSTGPTLRVFK